jgi:hypothetical protein
MVFDQLTPSLMILKFFILNLFSIGGLLALSLIVDDGSSRDSDGGQTSEE